MIESEIRKEQFEREKGWKETGRNTKKELADINMAEATMIESEIRKEQFEREKGWKETGRNTKKELADINMAKAVFG